MIPDYCEAITAYRAWDAHKNGLLVGQAHNEPWPPYQPFVGRCGYATTSHIHDGQWVGTPVLGCDCGIHAYKTAEAVETRIMHDGVSWMTQGQADRPADRVWGSVKLWGRVIEHALGWRAEFAYPGELFCGDKKLAAVVAALYGVPCVQRPVPQLKIEIVFEPFYAAFQQLSADIVARLDAQFVSGADNPPPGIVNATQYDLKPLSTDTKAAMAKHLGQSRWQRQQASKTQPTIRPGFRTPRQR